jgi:hypothetical protein
LNKKAKILLAVGALMLIMGALQDITRNPFTWSTGIVISLSTILLLRIDHLRTHKKVSNEV